MKYKDLHQKSVAELHALVRDLRAQVLASRFEASQGALKQNSKLRALRVQIAQALTALNAKQHTA